MNLHNWQLFCCSPVVSSFNHHKRDALWCIKLSSFCPRHWLIHWQPLDRIAWVSSRLIHLAQVYLIPWIRIEYVLNTYWLLCANRWMQCLATVFSNIPWWYLGQELGPDPEASEDYLAFCHLKPLAMVQSWWPPKWFLRCFEDEHSSLLAKIGGFSSQPILAQTSEPFEANLIGVDFYTVPALLGLIRLLSVGFGCGSRLGTKSWMAARMATLRCETSGCFVGPTYLVTHSHLRFMTLEPQGFDHPNDSGIAMGTHSCFGIWYCCFYRITL